ncbi:MAG: hypothetical protein IJX38_03795 [Clostridia bacterium]|nr:hypothetical protein [Clostridia bacterium]
MAYSKTKNLLKSRDVYNRYYGDFRGVDFSSDHTQVIEQRLAYAVNMYKDYQSGQGKALETIAGFRRRIVLPEEAEIYGIHHFQHKAEGSDILTKILIHAGNKLYLWHNYPNTIGVVMKKTVTLPEASETTSGGVHTFNIFLGENVAEIVGVYMPDGEDITINASYSKVTHTLTIQRSDLAAEDVLYLSYYEGAIKTEDALFAGMNARKSASFIFNNRLYIVDGKNYLYYDGSQVSSVLDNAYIPTTYKNIIPSGENADIGEEYEHRNLLQAKFKHTFYGDGENKVFYMNENELDAIAEVKVYGETLKAGEGYTVNLAEGKIELTEAPAKPADKNYPETHAGVEITAEKAYESEQITNCTLSAIFDERVFLSGNPDYPNNIYYCGRNNITGRTDPSYFPATNYVPDGVGMAAITGMLVVADTLMVLKGDTQQDGSVYFHTAYATGDDLHPKEYPSTRGLAGIGCLGACINFLDDPVFISRLGVEAVGQLSVRYERAIEHRSSLIDAKLVNMELKNASLEEWNGYLIALVDGKIFMADSRQRYTHDTGVVQYEWYYLEDIGIFKNQYLEYRYATRLYSEFEGVKVHYCTKCKKGAKQCTCGNTDHHIEIPISLANSVFYHDTGESKDLTGTIANAPGADGTATAEIFDELVNVIIDDTSYSIGVYYAIHEVYDELTNEFVRYEAYLCEGKGNYTGGLFNKACIVKSLENNLFFGTVNGIVCSFNFDTRNEMGEIPPQYYSFDERTIHCGCATKMDCCGVPHLTKNTVKKSTVVKTKSLQASAAKIKVRTNKKPYNQIARINSSLFSFENMDFLDYSFITTEQSLFSVKEKEKQWVEKQYYIYSDEYLKPFALYYISFRYNIAGRYKE